MQSSTKIDSFSARLSLWLRCSSIAHSFILIAVSTSMKFNFIWALLWVANPSRAVIKDEMRWWGLALQRKMASGIKFDEIETDMSTCFPIHVVVSVCFYEFASLKQTDSKSNNAKFLKCFVISIWDIECFQLVKKRFSQFVKLLWVIMFNTITTSNQISYQIPRLWEKCVTRSTSEGFGQCIDVVDVAKVIVVA